MYKQSFSFCKKIKLQVRKEASFPNKANQLSRNIKSREQAKKNQLVQVPRIVSNIVCGAFLRISKYEAQIGFAWKLAKNGEFPASRNIILPRGHVDNWLARNIKNLKNHSQKMALLTTLHLLSRKIATFCSSSSLDRYMFSLFKRWMCPHHATIINRCIHSLVLKHSLTLKTSFTTYVRVLDWIVLIACTYVPAYK